MVSHEILMWLTALFALAGSTITLIAALGVLRLPDFFMRMHAATKAGVVGPSLILVAAGCFYPSLTTWTTIFFTILFLFTTTPISAHLIGKAGFVGGVNLWRKTVKNDLEAELSAHSFIETEYSETAVTKPADMMADSHEVKPNR